ncbi:MAG: hypothetical protein KDH15_05890 [Rhodocyclaceae bacterium]|nr:hypothetical protein [Rhodocyclaceae bacterium]
MKTHALPLDFRLRNANDEPVLILGGPRDLTLEITNTSPTALFLNPLEHAHHFTLRFRAGVLHDHRNIGVDKAELAHWDVSAKEKHGDVLVHLRHKTLTNWAPDRTLRLTLEGLRGERAGGTRATRVELAYQHIRYDGAGGPLVTGKARHHQMVLAMPSPQALRLRPLLEAHFVGDTGNVVLNDGKRHAYTLKLRLTNTTPEWLLVGRTTELRVTLAAGPGDAFGALASREELLKYELTASILSPGFVMNEAMFDAERRGWNSRPDGILPGRLLLDCIAATDEPTWTLRLPENATGFHEITPDGYLEIEIGRIATGHANGPSNIRLQWLNLSHPDGDMAGEVVATLQKSPLVVVGHKVGIGSIPTPDGPDLDNDTIREALVRATRAMRAVVSSSIRGRVTLDHWQFDDGFAHFPWPTVSWEALDVYWPPGHGRVGIPMRDLTQREWRASFAWLKDYPDPGFPRYPHDVPFFHRSPHELFFLHDPAEARYLDGPPDDRHQSIQHQYAGKKASCRSAMGLPLKPRASLYVRIDHDGTADASRPWILFEDRTLADETRPDDWVFIARWDENGVTAGCDFNLGPSELKAVRLPPPASP